jgi:hypothetical protein
MRTKRINAKTGGTAVTPKSTYSSTYKENIAMKTNAGKRKAAHPNKNQFWHLVSHLPSFWSMADLGRSFRVHKRKRMRHPRDKRAWNPRKHVVGIKVTPQEFNLDKWVVDTFSPNSTDWVKTHATKDITRQIQVNKPDPRSSAVLSSTVEGGEFPLLTIECLK